MWPRLQPQGVKGCKQWTRTFGAHEPGRQRNAKLRSLATSAQSKRYYSGCACHGGNAKRTAYIALGSNLGDRIAEIEKACNEMDRRGIRVKRTSSLWETEPMYVKDQDRFINGACEVSSSSNQSSKVTVVLTYGVGGNGP